SDRGSRRRQLWQAERHLPKRKQNEPQRDQRQDPRQALRRRVRRLDRQGGRAHHRQGRISGEHGRLHRDQADLARAAADRAANTQAEAALRRRDPVLMRGGAKEMTQTALALDNAQTVRDEVAKRMRNLIRDWSANTIEMGQALREARDTFPEGPKGEAMGFKTWVRKAVGIGMRYAESLIAIADKFERLAGKQKLPSFRVMQFLARSTTPA